MLGCTRSLSLTVLVSAAVVFAPATALAQVEETVTVGSGARIEIKADLVTVIASVRAERKTAQGAQSALARKTHKIISALKAAGFKNIATTEIHLVRETHKGELIGYLGSLALKVKTGDTQTAGEIIDLTTGAGASGIRSVNFDVKDKRAAVKKALAEAMDFAKQKAKVLAESAGRTLGRALRIREGSTAPPRTLRLAFDTGGGGNEAPTPLPVKPPKLHASARIQVTFALI